MTKPVASQVISSNHSQFVAIPARFRFITDEVYVRRMSTGDLNLSPVPRDREEIFAAIDATGFEEIIEQTGVES